LWEKVFQNIIKVGSPAPAFPQARNRRDNETESEIFLDEKDDEHDKDVN